MFAGSETFLLQTLRAGGAGCITATGKVHPTAILKLYREWRQQDAQAQQAALDATRALFQKHPIIAAMKAAIAWKSGDAQWSTVRPPLVALDAAQRAHLQADLEADGFTIPNAAALAGIGSPAMAAAA